MVEYKGIWIQIGDDASCECCGHVGEAYHGDGGVSWCVDCYDEVEDFGDITLQEVQSSKQYVKAMTDYLEIRIKRDTKTLSKLK